MRIQKGLSDEAVKRIGSFVRKGQEEWVNPFDQFDEINEPEESDYSEPDAEELVMFVTNDSDLYFRQTIPIIKNPVKN